MITSLSHALSLLPLEQESLSPETTAALERARASLLRGEGVRHEEIRREFGADNCHQR